MRINGALRAAAVLVVVLAAQACCPPSRKENSSIKKATPNITYTNASDLVRSIRTSDTLTQPKITTPSGYVPRTTYPNAYKPLVAENGSYYGEQSRITGLPKTTYVRSYVRKDGTYVRSHYRSRR